MTRRMTLTTHTRLGLAFLTMGFLIAVMGITSVVSVYKIADRIENLYRGDLLPVQHLYDLRTQIWSMRTAIVSHILAYDSASMTTWGEAIVETQETIDKTLKAYRTYLSSELEQQAFARLQEEWAAYQEIRTEVLRLSLLFAKDAASELQQRAGLTRLQAIDQELTTLIDLNRATADANYASSTAQIGQLVRANMIMVVGGLGCAVLLGWVISRRIANGLGSILQATRALGAGHLQARSVVQSNDDIGELAQSFNSMATKLETNLNAVIEAETALKEAQYLAKIGSWHLDQAAGHMTWSDQLYAILELDRATCDSTSKTFLMLVHPDDRERVHSTFIRHQDNRLPYALSYRLLMPDGRLKHVHERGETRRGADGTSLFSLGTIQDTTEQVRIEQALRTSEHRFELAMQAANDGLWDWNMVTDEVYFSPRWKSMLGYSSHELDDTFSTWERLVDSEGHAQTMRLIHQAVSGQSDGFAIEFRMRHKNGQWIDILSRAAIVRTASGEPLRMVGTHVDITERKAIQHQLEITAEAMAKQNEDLQAAHKLALSATEAKSTFLATMSHEIRTPLNAISGMTELLTESPLNPVQSDYVRRLSRASDHLLALISDILDLSKIDAGHLELERVPFDPTEVVHNRS